MYQDQFYSEKKTQNFKGGLNKNLEIVVYFSLTESKTAVKEFRDLGLF